LKITLISTAVAAAIAAWAPLSSARQLVALPYIFGANPGDTVGQATGLDTTGGALLTVNPNININALNDVGGGITNNINDTASILFVGNSTVTGFTGTSTIRFNAITAGANATTVNFNGNVFTTTFNVSGTGTVNFNGSVNPGIVAASTIFAGDGFINVGANQLFNSALTTITANTGTLTLNGGSSVIGAIGGASGLKQINVSGGNAAITGAVQARGFSLGTNTLTITGALTTNVGGTIATTLASNALFGKILPNGASNISATGITVIPTVTGVLTPGTTFRIVNGLAGTNGATVNVVNTNPLYTFVGVPTTTGDVNIRVVLAPLATSTADAAAASIFGVTAAAGSDLLAVQNAIVALGDTAAINSAVAQLSPNSANLGAPWVAGQATRLFEDLLLARRDEIQGVCCDSACEANNPNGLNKTHLCKSDEKLSNWWGKGFGSFGRQGNVDNVIGFDTKASGVVLAYEKALNYKTRLGFGGGYANSTIDGKNSTGRTNIDSYQVMAYLNYAPGPWFMQGSLMAGVDRYDGSRPIVFPGVNRTAVSNYTGQQYTGLISAGQHFYFNNQVTVTPLASLQASHIRVGSYTESGAGDVNLIVDSQNYNFIQSSLGVKVERVISSGNGTYSPEAHFNWLHDFKSTTMAENVAFTGGGTPFSAEGIKQDRELYNVGVGLTFLSCNCDKNSWTVKGLYDYKWNQSEYSSHQVSIIAGLKF
jgi:uncharacterized protein with beta-barrel porin domain